MKESDITPEIITKAKEIASLWRMEIYEGCWIQVAIESDAHPDELLIFNPEKMFVDNVALRFSNGCYYIDWYPIPSISDCLEKLGEFANENITIFIDTSMIWFVTLDMYTKEKKTNESKSLHLALLSALLEALVKRKRRNKR